MFESENVGRNQPVFALPEHVRNTRLAELYVEEVHTLQRDLAFLACLQRERDSLEHPTSFKSLAAKGRIWGGELKIHLESRTHGSRHRMNRSLVDALSNNGIAHGLMACLDDPSEKMNRTRHILRFISNYRMHASDATVWQMSGEAPPLDRMKEFLGLAGHVSLNSKNPAPQRVALFALVIVFAQRLIARSAAHLLDSPAYRKLLWENLEAVIWFESCRDIHEAVISGGEWLPIGTPPDPNSYLWLIAEYGYVVLEIERDLRLHEHFRNAAQHEILLYHSRADYRDHLLHATGVFLLGFLLLRGKPSPVPIPRRKEANLKLMRNWFIAALCHDFGYAYELIPAAYSVAGTLAIGEAAPGLADSVRTWTEHLKTMNDDAKESCVLQAGIGTRQDHGVISYLHMRTLLRSLDSVRQPLGDKVLSVQSEHCKKYARGLTAILKHNLFTEPIPIRRNLLEGLLVISDELQEWRRLRFGSWALTQWSLSAINFSRMVEAQPRRICEAVEIPGLALTDAFAAVAWEAKDCPRIVLRYADQNVNVFEPLSRVLAKVYNLERIEGLRAVKLVLEIHIPLLRSFSRLCGDTGQELSELEILREFCLLKEVGISPQLYSFQDDARCGKTKCSCFKRSLHGRPYDVIALDFQRFPQKPRDEPLVSKAPWEFEKELWAFKQEYCRKNLIQCAFFGNDDEWPVQQIVGAVETR